MTPRAHIPAAVEAELSNARTALDLGNDGKARVCARRAAGAVLAAFYGTAGQGPDAMGLLVRASDDRTLPDNVRAAAFRLTTRVGERDVRPFSTDPVGDARTIVDAVSARTGPDGAP